MRARALLSADQRLFDRMTTRPSRRVDAVVYPLSRAADNAKLWVACAALLAASRNERARRAAARGLVAVGVTSTVCNAVVKPIFRRARPAYVRSEFLRREAKVPGSTSFPSGHSASAFAFAVAAGMEMPAVAAPITALAAGVAYSRVRTRVHFPADVIAGAAIGSAVAVATRALRRPGGTGPASVTRRSTTVNGPATSDGDDLAIVVNVAAGSSDAGSSDALRADLPGAEIIVVGDDESIDDALGRASGASMLGIVGGDGSINAAAAHALATNRPLAVFPGGTLNHFARDLGTNDAADTVAALRDGALVAVDVGVIDGKPFLNTASFGSYADFVDEREKLEHRLGKWAAALVAAAKVLRHAEPMRVEIDGVRRDIWMIFIGNCEYQPPGLAPSARPRLDDGLLDVRYVDCAPRSRLRLLRALATGRLAHTDVFKRTLVPSLDIHSLAGPLRLARDGETFDGGVDVRVAKHPGALAVYAPTA